jgi:superkiller protein 3
LSILLVNAPAAPSEPARPLTRSEVLVLLDLGDGNGRVEQLVSRKGIAFTPDSGFLSTLHSLGANDALLQRLQRTTPATNAANPLDADLYPEFLRCFQLAKQKLFAPAESACRSTIKEDPVLGNFALGEVLLYQRKYEEAAASFQSTLEANPNSAEAHNYLGIARETADSNEAHKEYRLAIRLDPDYATAHSNLAYSYFQRGDLSRAYSEAERAIALDSSDPSAHNNLGAVLRAQGNVDGALLEFRKAVELDPNDATRYANLAQALEATGDLPAAISQLQRAASLEPDNANWPTLLCEVSYRSTNYTQAVSACERAIQLDPNNAVRYSNLAVVLDENQEFAQAVVQWREAVRLQPTQFNYRLSLTKDLYKIGRFEEALIECQSAEKLAPHDRDLLSRFCKAIQEKTRKRRHEEPSSASPRG